MDFSRENIEFKLEHYKDLCKLTVDKIIYLPERTKRFTQIYNEYGAAYLAKRAAFRASARFDKNRYIDYAQFQKLNRPSKKYVELQKNYYALHAQDGVMFVIYIYTDGATPAMLERSKESIRKQTYRPVKAFSGRLKNMEEKVETFLQVADAKRVRIVKMHAGDELNQEFCYRLARFWENDPEADIVYTDHDEWPGVNIDPKNIRPFFKPDYSMEYLCAYYYIGPSFATRADVWRQSATELMTDDELFMLKNASENRKIGHIHRLLYSVKQSENATEAVPADEKLKTEYIEKMYMEPGIREVSVSGSYGEVRTVSVKWKDTKKVSVLIPNMNHADDLYNCLRALCEQTILQDMEIIIAENNSDIAETFAFYKWILDGEQSVHLSALDLDEDVRRKLDGRVKVVFWEGGEFNYSAINNFARSHATGNYMLLLNNDVELINSDAVEIMLASCRRSGVGAVGAKLFYDDETIQHAGVIIGFGGVAAHQFAGRSMYDCGYMHQADCVRRVSAVTAACMMVSAGIYDELGGLDESFAVAFNDVDFCMKIGKAGYSIIYQPLVRGWHYESKSRGKDTTGAKMRRFSGEINRFIVRYVKDILNGDPYYNHNLSLTHDDYSYRDPYWFDKDF
ncbi:MAG: glycosyltransferase [Lachnospiraceae bacterium]|nr:glycosyltransferase [Lachnospiraceae bacterium]